MLQKFCAKTLDSAANLLYYSLVRPDPHEALRGRLTSTGRYQPGTESQRPGNLHQRFIMFTIRDFAAAIALGFAIGLLWDAAIALTAMFLLGH